MFSGHNCSCQSGPKLCDYENFTEIITRNGVCHQLQLEPHVTILTSFQTVQEIQLLLDPQEYDYLLPNQGVAGFRVWLHASASQALAEMQADLNDPYVKLQTLNLERRGIYPNEVVLSTEFNTIVRVAVGFELSRQAHVLTLGTSCSLPTHCSTNEKTSSNFLPDSHNVRSTKETSSSDERKLRFIRDAPPATQTVQVISTTQAPKSFLLHSLLALQNPGLFKRQPVHVAWGLRIQQRAFLQLTNRTAFDELNKLVGGFSELQNELEKTTARLRLIQSNLWKDERELLQRSSRDGHCVADLLQQVNALTNITANFHEDLCKLPMTDGIHIGKVLQCQKDNKHTTEHLVSPEKLTQAMLSTSHRNQIKTLNRFTSNPTEPVNIDEQLVTTQPSLTELQIVHLLFVSSSTDSQLKDVLRNYLRTLSAKRMQIRPRAGEYVSPRALSSKTISHVLDDSNEAANAEGFPAKFSTDPCDSRLQLKLSEKYYKFLVEIGENIATCLQRLESFKSSLLGIVSANIPIINAFQISQANLSRIPHTRLVKIVGCSETNFICQRPIIFRLNNHPFN
ncbi:hypothetical protein P879_00858 [Paragonimus westermani]|uniref:Uncharacterized protein n=1 Tax=Paragonimus westermani TaxID=34504 RepID=A0A8T0DYV6_9TREM|nr:hypothetical protein P879_00858 [Paragonimus westermani]